MRLSKTKRKAIRDMQADARNKTPEKKKKERKELLERIRAVKTFQIVIPIEKKPNRKKNRKLRRSRANLGVYVPYPLRHPVFLNHPLTGNRTIFDGFKGFRQMERKQQRISDGLIERAKIAFRLGSYDKLNGNM